MRAVRTSSFNGKPQAPACQIRVAAGLPFNELSCGRTSL
jgi:hypothetical protein